MLREPGTNARPDCELAIVVGAGGLGLALARRLAQRFRLLIVDLDPAKAEAAAAALQAEGSDAAGHACDITDAGSIAKLAAEVRAQGGFRALAHVVGLSPSMADFAQIIRVNLTGAALVAEGLVDCARSGAAGVFVSSLAAHGFTPPEGCLPLLRDAANPDLADLLQDRLGLGQATPAAAYQLSKSGLMMLCRRSAIDWGRRGARILSISPGLIATPMGALEFEKSEGKRRLYAMTPLQRDGSMLEIADAVEFLVSDRASFISGTDLLVDGGLAAAMSEMAFA